MSESDVPTTAFRGRKLAVCALVLALLCLILGGYVVVRLDHVDRQIASRTTRKGESVLILVPGVGMGDVRFGMARDEVITHLGEPERIADNGLSLLYRSHGFSITVYPRSGVSGFTCSATAAVPPFSKWADFRGQTREGIRIGSKAGDIVAAYGQPGTRKAGGRQTELTYPDRGMHFILLDDRLVHFYMWLPKPDNAAPR